MRLEKKKKKNKIKKIKIEKILITSKTIIKNRKSGFTPTNKNILVKVFEPKAQKAWALN